jgi:CBS domain containing-hemolysin-like protein
MTFEFTIIALSLLLSAFFSGMEIAYVSSNKVYVEIEKQQQGIFARLLKIITTKPSKFIATMLIGNNIALVVYGLFMGNVLLRWFQSLETAGNMFINYLIYDLNLLTQTVISTVIILITAEFLPKVFFQIYANRLLKFFVVPAYIFYVFFSLLSDFVIWISDLLLKLFFKTSGDKAQLVFSKVELGNYISEQMQTVNRNDEVDSEIQIFQNALEFSEVKSREVMVPRIDLVAVDVHVSLESLSTLFTKTGFSKIIVYTNSIDDILGYVHSFDLFKKPKNVRSIVMPVEFVPETMLIKDVLNVLTKKRKSLAVVLDEYGGTSGIMTVEDIVEELFGEIEDEHDKVELVEEVQKDGSLLLSARLEVDYLNETYKINLPQSEAYETLGGLLVNQTEEIPQKGQDIQVGEFKFTVEQVSTNKIDLLRLHFSKED